MNINDVGYNVTIGEPVVDAKGVADSGLSFPCKAIPDGDYLVTLEVNGTVIAGRDKATFASGSATVGDYTLSYSSYAVSVATLTDDDVVVLRIEPLDVKVSDAFRAVVGKAAPAGGGSGGSSDEPLIYEVEETVYTGVLGEYEKVSPILSIKACKLNDDWTAVMSTLTESELDSAVVYVDGVADGYHLDIGGGHVGGTLETDAGKPVAIKVTKTKTSPALINLYDPNSEDTETYFPDGAYNSENSMFTLDVSAAYERLKRGQNVWIRWYCEGDVVVDQVIGYYVDDEDTLNCSSWYRDGSMKFTNYTGSEPEINPQPDPGE